MVLTCSLTVERHGRASTKKGKGGRGDGGGEEQLHVDPEAGLELKEALEVRIHQHCWPNGWIDGWMQVGWVGRFLVCKVARWYILVPSYVVDCVPQVCEYGLGVCAGVPVADRGGLLGVWVQCKQLLQQPIPGKTFGVEEKVGIVLQVISQE